MMILKMLMETLVMWSPQIGDFMGIDGSDLQFHIYQIARLIFGYVGMPVG